MNKIPITVLIVIAFFIFVFSLPYLAYFASSSYVSSKVNKLKLNVAKSIYEDHELEGEDLDGNNVRDDVDRWISEQNFRDDVKNALVQYASFFQEHIHTNRPDNKKLYKFYKLDRARNCLRLTLENDKELLKQQTIMGDIGSDKYERMRREYYKKLETVKHVLKDQKMKDYENAKRKYWSLLRGYDKFIKSFDDIVNNNLLRKSTADVFRDSRGMGVFISPDSVVEVCDFYSSVEGLRVEIDGYNKKYIDMFESVVKGTDKLLWCHFRGKTYNEKTVAENLKFKDVLPIVQKTHRECYSVKFKNVTHFHAARFLRNKPFRSDGILVGDYNDFIKVLLKRIENEKKRRK